MSFSVAMRSSGAVGALPAAARIVDLARTAPGSPSVLLISHDARIAPLVDVHLVLCEGRLVDAGTEAPLASSEAQPCR